MSGISILAHPKQIAMKRIPVFLGCFVAMFFILGCSTPNYFHDASSFERQKELKKHRSGNIFTDIGLTLTSIFVLAATDVNIGLYPQGQEFKKMKIINPAEDTLYVNMLTDVYWDENNYCDFMDLRIPPKQKCKILVPVDAVYNIYFSNTPQADDDELIQLNTNELNKIALYDGLTENEKITNLNQIKK